MTFAAEGVPTGSRVEYWRHVLGDVVGSLEPYGGLPRTLSVADAGPVRVGDMVVDRPGGANRGRRHIRSDEPDLYKVDVVVRGRGVVEQDGRSADLAQGDLTLVDIGRPARWSMSSMRVVTLAFPWPMLQVRRDDVARLTAVRMRGAAGTTALLSTFVRELADRMHELDTVDPRLGTALVDLVTAALYAELGLGRRLPPDTRQRVLLQHMQRYVEAHLGDTDLSPTTLAAAHHVSLRYLYKLFEREHVTVTRLIQQRRLERCRRDLLDPTHATKPVSAIAARWGLTSAAHFSKLFRGAYGMTPTEYRVTYAASPARPEESP